MGVRDSATAVYQVGSESAYAHEDKVPRGYKRTEVGVIPEDWGVHSLGSICGITAGGDLVKAGFSSAVDPSCPYPIYSNALANDGLYGYSRSWQYGPCCVTVTARGDIGHASYRASRFCAIGRLLVLAPKYPLDMRVISEAINNVVNFALESTGVPQLTAPQIAKNVIPLPPTKAEQEAIAEALGDADALIESLQQLIAKKRAIKQGAMQALLTGRQHLPGFWEGWQRKKIDDVFQMRIAGSKAQFINNGGAYYIVDMGSVSRDGHLIVSKVTDHDRDRLMEGELVMPKDDIGGGNIIGKVAYIDASNRYVLGDHVYALRAMSGDPRFFAYLINGYETNHALRSKVGGSAQLGLSQQAVREQEIYFPPLAEQTAIATVLFDIDAEIEALEARLAKTRALKAGMMQALLTGRIRLPLDRAA